jgi:hypothetical protein
MSKQAPAVNREYVLNDSETILSKTDPNGNFTYVNLDCLQISGYPEQELLGKHQSIMREITAASQEQSAGIGQVNQAITQMDEVTQQNAALVEQAATAAKSMQEQAGKLARLVSAFKLVSAGQGTQAAPLQILLGRGSRMAPIERVKVMRVAPLVKTEKLVLPKKSDKGQKLSVFSGK